MMEVLYAAPLATVQDLGRHGYRHLGIGQAGVMDPVAARQANLLVGNTPDQAVLEFSHGPLRMRFAERRRIALMGSDFQASWQTDKREPAQVLPPGIACELPAGAVLSLAQPHQAGLRAYLAVAGGIAVDEVLGSRSTDLNSAFGGMQGRPLRAGDRLPLGAEYPALAIDLAAVSSIGIRPLPRRLQLRAITGPEYKDFTIRAQSDIWQQRWLVSAQSNRMGLRLHGEPLLQYKRAQMSSSAVLPGVIQVPGDGQPIILANDAQTTGGYARIATIIEADRWCLAYLLPGDHITLHTVSLAEALSANTRLQHYLEQQTRRLGAQRS